MFFADAQNLSYLFSKYRFYQELVIVGVFFCYIKYMYSGVAVSSRYVLKIFPRNRINITFFISYHFKVIWTWQCKSLAYPLGSNVECLFGVFWSSFQQLSRWFSSVIKCWNWCTAEAPPTSWLAYIPCSCVWCIFHGNRTTDFVNGRKQRWKNGFFSFFRITELP